MVAVPLALSVIVWFGPAFTVYVTKAFGVPVNVTVADWPAQIVWFAEIEAVGSGTTVITAVPVAGALQLGLPPDATLTSDIVVVAE